MQEPNIPALIGSICRQREKIIKQGVSGKNNMLCLKYIRDFKAYVEAYQRKWSHDAWRNYLARHSDELVYLIPSNKSGESILKKVYEIL